MVALSGSFNGKTLEVSLGKETKMVVKALSRAA